jgi:hypothetical protein
MYVDFAILRVLVSLQMKMFTYYNKTSYSTRETLKASCDIKITYHKIYYMTFCKRYKILINIKHNIMVKYTSFFEMSLDEDVHVYLHT